MSAQRAREAKQHGYVIGRGLRLIRDLQNAGVITRSGFSCGSRMGGKTEAMRCQAAAWQAEHPDGRVITMSPS